MLADALDRAHERMQADCRLARAELRRLGGHDRVAALHPRPSLVCNLRVSHPKKVKASQSRQDRPNV
jgi:hypothetical protein